jgi:hypothetical protein
MVDRHYYSDSQCSASNEQPPIDPVTSGQCLNYGPVGTVGFSRGMLTCDAPSTPPPPPATPTKSTTHPKHHGSSHGNSNNHGNNHGNGNGNSNNMNNGHLRYAHGHGHEQAVKEVVGVDVKVNIK